jgi:hypothetical protein
MKLAAFNAAGLTSIASKVTNRCLRRSLLIGTPDYGGHVYTPMEPDEEVDRTTSTAGKQGHNLLRMV